MLFGMLGRRSQFSVSETYTVGFGFLVPSNCVVNLNGATIQATTTFGQGSLPTNAGFRAVFACAGSLTNGATLSGYTENILINGGGALIDMRYDEQTGTVPGSIGITVETTPAPIVGNEGKVRNVVVRDVTIDQACGTARMCLVLSTCCLRMFASLTRQIWVTLACLVGRSRT